MGIFDGAVSVFSKIAFRFEFFFPQFIGYFVGQKLKDYKEKGLIEDYKLKDADVAIICLSSTAGTTKVVCDNLRKKGLNKFILTLLEDTRDK